MSKLSEKRFLIYDTYTKNLCVDVLKSGLVSFMLIVKEDCKRAPFGVGYDVIFFRNGEFDIRRI